MADRRYKFVVCKVCMFVVWCVRYVIGCLRTCNNKLQTTRKRKDKPMNRIRKFYNDYKPYIFSDGWYYVFIVIFILLLFVFFS